MVLTSHANDEDSIAPRILVGLLLFIEYDHLGLLLHLELHIHVQSFFSHAFTSLIPRTVSPLSYGIGTKDFRRECMQLSIWKSKRGSPTNASCLGKIQNELQKKSSFSKKTTTKFPKRGQQ